MSTLDKRFLHAMIALRPSSPPSAFGVATRRLSEISEGPLLKALCHWITSATYSTDVESVLAGDLPGDPRALIVAARNDDVAALAAYASDQPTPSARRQVLCADAITLIRALWDAPRRPAVADTTQAETP